ncbi:MAG: hypothetical protein R8G34_07055 [Paracoccaceae bacterium]|nr:hypothetical protein [Paracoccaceae bacterium]
MSWSQAEIMALAGKAARGAGAPPGQAAQFGKAAAVHLARGRSATELEHALSALPTGPIMSCAVEIERILMMAAGTDEISVGIDPQTPLGLLESYLDALPFDVGITEVAPNSLRLTRGDASSKTQRPPERISGCDSLIAQMTDLAAKTFVPESDASRRAGAGAGLSDND